MTPSLRPYLLLGALVALACNLFAATRDELWLKVSEAEASRLPQIALNHLEPIIQSALADQAHAEAIKAIAKKVVLETQIQGGRPEESIPRFQAELDRAPAELRPILQTLLAHSYWNYFQQNRWSFLQRSQTAAPPSDDFQTWDLSRILHEIDARFTAALSHKEFLQNTPIESYDAFLTEGAAPVAFRPTLYDFVVHEALSFYQTGEQGAIAAENPFPLSAQSPLFDPAPAFLAWSPEPPENDSPEFKAIQLYQDLLRFHQNDPDPSAYIDADLARITYAFNAATGEQRESRYQSALETFIENAARHEISSLARARLAQFHYQSGDALTAHRIAQTGKTAFPESIGANFCHNLIQEIEAKSAQLSTEAVWNAPYPTLELTYRNLTRVYFRAIPADFEAIARQGSNYRHSFDREHLLDSKPVLEWQAELPPTDDYKERTESLAAPETLSPGYYHIVASFDPDFSEHENLLSQANVWVSELALVVRSEFDEDRSTQVNGFVLDARTGRPLAGAKVRIWNQTQQGNYKPGDQSVTDSDGRYFLKQASRSYRYLVHASHQGQAVATDQNNYSARSRAIHNKPTQKTVFFTDRSLYRPGQTVHYKGICIESDREQQRYATLTDQKVTVVFLDRNRQEIATATHRANNYGSFSGSFTAPDSGLSGSMTIRTLEGPHGSTVLSVEEYKRPQFQAELLSPEAAPKLGETVSLTGKATAYTGAAIGGAKVAWRVERSARGPIWCWWWEPQGSQAIAHGETETAADGSFAIEFQAAPDPAISRDFEPVFSYTVYADVTDTNGETRSARLVTRAGYTALQASLAHETWQTIQDPVAVTLDTSSLDGDPQSARGTLTVYHLEQPQTVQRSSLAPPHRWWDPIEKAPRFDPSNPSSWEKGQRLSSHRFRTGPDGQAKLSLSLPAGPYRLELATKDRFGQDVTALSTLTVVDPDAEHFSIKLPQFLEAPTYTCEPGQTFSALWGTGYSEGQAYIEILSQGRSLQSYWSETGHSQALIEFPITEAHRGGITLRTTFVRENRSYTETKRINVPWTNKQLAVKWERFRSKLKPGEAETWTATLSGPDAERAAAEMVAGLYDASLDQYRTHNWIQSFASEFRHEAYYHSPSFANELLPLHHFAGYWSSDYRSQSWSHRRLPPWLAFGYQQDFYRSLPRAAVSSGANDEVFELSSFSIEAAPGEGYRSTNTLAGSRLQQARLPVSLDDVSGDSAMKMEISEPAAPPPAPNLSQVSARKNLNETAFFYPHLLSDEEGVVKIQFTMPEALTQWRFFGFAHDNELRSGFLTDTAVTAKDLMVQPNPPRFLREGDEVEFTVKVSNQSESEQSGQVRLSFADAATLEAADASLQNLDTDKSFTIPAKESRTYSWRLKVPDGARVLTYKAVGATESLSDGEEGFLPVLSRRVLITESLPLPIRNEGSKRFDFDKLLASGNSDTLQHQSLTVQMVSQPAWYAVLALPYLMEFPHECSEQLFSRYYANTLGSHIAQSDPTIRRIFELWKNTAALDSPLEKNQELKSVLIEETPWLRDAQSESQARRRLGNLFAPNRLADESARALQKLAERQLGDGRWSWFPGGRGSDYITLYIATGFARLRHLGVEIDMEPAIRSLEALDRWMHERYQDIQENYEDPQAYVPDHYIALYLYGRSFYLQDQPLANAHRKALDFFLDRAREHWTKVSSRQSEAHLALALQRFGDSDVPSAILKSLKERSVTDEELGMFWRDSESRGWWWYHAPIETQALMIEAFGEVAENAEDVENLKVWLLKQKQTQNWKTTKATADAVYALLLRGQNLLASDALVAVKLGDTTIAPENVEAGTGYYEKRFLRQEVQPEMGRITVTKSDDGVSWGSVHWQYLEDMSKVTPHEGTPLTLKKTLFVKQNTARGPVLKAVDGPLSVGDELVVRLELRSDRDMEYLHLKDQRGSGTEPVNVLSGYRYQDRLGYYESTRDTASHFFIDYLPKGTYVFEYSTRVQLKGSYQSGIAEIQCMYAPEFNSHSESQMLKVE
ncbi:alpha-2-macroglobulin family protein [Pelagicoccus sp. SDUM812005]|uniref:alpha-2-macroglobulin family protein n=1 Tax=Pelagicoccus sp. SDUM812005 TaxID=3041257 RepID=UPI00280C54EA|nr:alpha-2-macroglobulin family protein [Pelagicoccus sp. SDUM812005]MDQ8181929.1 alpha-2-macroglobulin family protein [Pelagicoccus sp. SDUM812005]